MSEIKTIATVGEIIVEFASHQLNCGLEQIADYSGPYPSGAPAIFLDQATLMGANSEMIGGVGADGFGRGVLKRLKDDGVGVNGVNISNDHSTGVAFVSYYDDGERDFIFHLANTAADQINIPTDLLVPEHTSLHVSACSLGISSAMRDEIMGAVRTVKNAGGQITCDPNARPELMSESVVRDALFEIIDCSYCLLPSTSDLNFLYPELSEEAATERLLKSNAEIIAIKRGEDGATVVGFGERYDFGGHVVEELDPTGAGDCFCGTFVSLLSQGVSLYEAGRQANAAGAIAVTRRGAMEGNSKPSEIADFLEKSTPREFSV